MMISAVKRDVIYARQCCLEILFWGKKDARLIFWKLFKILYLYLFICSLNYSFYFIFDFDFSDDIACSKN